MSQKPNFYKEPFETKFGTVNPGDEVAYLTVSTGWPSFGKAVYLGYTQQNEAGSKQKIRLAELSKRNVLYIKGTNTSMSWSIAFNRENNWKNDSVEYREEPYTRIRSLQLNRIIPIKGTK